MDTVNAMVDLEEKIRQLKVKEAHQLNDLKELYGNLVDSVNPKNVIQSAFRNVVETPGLQATMLNTAVSLGAGFLTNKFVVRGSGNIFRKIAGLATQFIVTNLVRNKIPEIKDNNHP